LKDFLNVKNIIALILGSVLGIIFAGFTPKVLSFGSTEILNNYGKSSIVLFQFMVFIISLIAPLAIISKASFGSKKSGKYGDQGTAKEGSVGDLRQLSGKDGFALSKNFRLSGDKSYEHVAVIGPTGSGKSSSFFIPNLLDMDGQKSAVVTDPKGEMYSKTVNYLRSIGYNVVKLTPLNPEKTDQFYNPILISDDNNELREVAQIILANGGKSMEMMSGASAGGADWLNMAIPLLAAALCYVKEKGRECTVEEAINLILLSTFEELSMLMETVPAANRNFMLFKASSESSKTMSSIKSVFANNVQIFTDENIIKFTKTPFVKNAYNDIVIDKSKVFNPKTLRKRPTIVFICVPEIKSTYAMPLMSVFYSQVLEKCMTTDGLPVLFYLDEFANIGTIPSIAGIIATARSRQIGISVGLQGIEQLRRNYGEENAMDILNNLKTKLIYSGLTGESANYISDLAGVTTIESTSFSNQQGDLTNLFGGKNVSKQGIGRNLFMPDEIRRMDPNMVLIIAHDKNPVKDHRNNFFNQRKYMKKVNMQ